MENQVFKRDYRALHKEKADNQHSNDILDCAINTGFFAAYDEALKKIPKVIVPEDKKAYEELLPRLDAMAREYGGTIHGIIDYERYDAHIYVTLPFLEFSRFSDDNLLRDIGEKAHLVTITPTEDGYVELSIMINYFAEICDTSNLLEQTIQENDILMDTLCCSMSTRMEQIKNNPIFRAILEHEASYTDLSPDEFFDNLIIALDQNPDIARDIIKKIEKKRGEEFWKYYDT